MYKPLTGRIAADLITEGKTFIDVSKLSPERFSSLKKNENEAI